MLFKKSLTPWHEKLRLQNESKAMPIGKSNYQKNV